MCIDGRDGRELSGSQPKVIAAGGLHRAALLWGFEAMAASQANREMLTEGLVPTRPALVVHGHFHVRCQSTCSCPVGRARKVGLGADCGDTAANLWVADVGELRSITEQINAGHELRPGLWSARPSGFVRHYQVGAQEGEGHG